MASSKGKNAAGKRASGAGRGYSAAGKPEQAKSLIEQNFCEELQ
jgi:hypothetical protein